MRLLHTSDWHLGQNFFGKSRYAEHKEFLKWLLNQIKQHNIDVVIVAGDIFDTGTPPSYARELYYQFVVDIQAQGCELIVVAGNHDSPSMLAESKQLLAKLSTHVTATIKANSTDCVIPIYDSAKTLQGMVCAIPYIRPRDVITSQAGEQFDDKNEQLKQAITSLYQSVFEHAKHQSYGNTPIIMTGHLTTVGASTTDSVREIYIGNLSAFPSNGFPKADYIALGHIHQHQQVGTSENIQYSGSPIALSFDELNKVKSVNLVDFENKKVKISQIEVPQFQPMAVIKGTLDELPQKVNNVVSNKHHDKPFWLSIEVNSADYLTDLHERIQTICKDYSVEVLTVRRAKHKKEQLNAIQESITLDEMTIMDVFTNRLNEESFETEQAVQRKQRLESIFKQIVEDMEHEQ